MQYIVGLKAKGKTGHITVVAEDALIAALKAKAQQPDSTITYVKAAEQARRHPPPLRRSCEGCRVRFEPHLAEPLPVLVHRDVSAELVEDDEGRAAIVIKLVAAVPPPSGGRLAAAGLLAMAVARRRRNEPKLGATAVCTVGVGRHRSGKTAQRDCAGGCPYPSCRAVWRGWTFSDLRGRERVRPRQRPAPH